MGDTELKEYFAETQLQIDLLKTTVDYEDIQNPLTTVESFV